MLLYKAGYKYVPTGVHAQVLDFPAAITFATDLPGARQALAVALVDVAEAAVECGQPLPVPDPKVSDPEMDIEELIYLYLTASTEVQEVPARAMVGPVLPGCNAGAGAAAHHDYPAPDKVTTTARIVNDYPPRCRSPRG